MAALGFQLTPFKKLIYAYPWPLYNLVILPKSFHLGGMENPVFNFYSATVISGDRENISVLAHEFAHSYSGNLVTNASWEHFWLNEGWTVYIERHILSELRGDDERKLHSMIGWQELLYGIKSYGGNESPSTRLVLDFQNQRPDDVMSKISYEKGYVFLCYLEGLVGNEKWLSFIPHVRIGLLFGCIFLFQMDGPISSIPWLLLHDLTASIVLQNLLLQICD